MQATVWKNAGKLRYGSILQTYKQDKLLYKMRIKTEQSAETECFTNDLYDALMKKYGREFWHVWKSKFETTNSRNVLVSGISDGRAIADAFAKHFKEVCAPHSHSEHRNTELKAVYTEMRSSYVSLMDLVEHEPSSEFDVQLLSELIAKMKRGKAAGLDELSVEHLITPLL